MKYFFVLITLTQLTFAGYSQNSQLMGRWILDRKQFSNGDNLEINDPTYSTKLMLLVTQDSLRILNQTFKTTYTDTQIKTPFRTINYLLKDGYLITQDEQDDKISFFLRPHDFVKKYPEFTLKEQIRNLDTIYIANNISDYIFEHSATLEDFILNNLSESGRSSTSFNNLYFQVEFILTRTNQIKDINVLHSIDKEYDNDYIAALKTSAPFLKNLSDKDLLITQEVNELKWYKELTDSSEKKLFELRADGLDFYNLNNFKKAIEFFSETKNLPIKNNRFKTFQKECLIKLAISYLAIGNMDAACNTFNQIGDKTDFQIRNYLIDYCAK
ncbi:MAG: hypothetical protein EAY81_10090 [Bacteroidetes bacterium]|nr:MAG: hypothetical protein EAY81_10090 [Bacteroidota bacterium]